MKMKLLILVAAAAFACTPSVPQNTTPEATTATVAVFNTTTGNIPLPNDIVFQQTAGLPPAQQQLLGAFVAKGGFPSDQDLPITVSFSTQSSGTDGGVASAAPDIDLSTFNSQTVFVFAATATAAGTVPFATLTAADYVKGPTAGTLSIHNVNHKPWPGGQYIAFIRGGANGVKTVGGTPIFADATFFLIAQGQELNTEANLAVLRAQTGSTVAAQAAAEQLDAVINQYKAGAFPVVDRFFPHQELATMTTFHIAPTHSVIAVDPARGIAPLPIDLLRDPRPPAANCAACGKLTPLAACTFASGTFNAANGTCSQAAAAAGFATLDGFSTTGLITAPVSTDLVPNLDATSVTPATVQVYDLSANPPVLVDPTTYITEPAEVQQSGFSPVVALQPAGATGSDPTSVFRTKPLKENTSYAVVISDGVKDQAGNPLRASTVGSVLQITVPLVDSNGNSQLSGIDNPTAGALEAMRQQLTPVYTAAAGHGIPKSHVIMAYTFKTQSILTVATQLGALPYQNNANPQDVTFNTAAITASDPTTAFNKFGVPLAVPHGNINQVLETTVTTFNLLDPTTGAFNPDPTKAAPEQINVLIATPKATAPAPTCGGQLAAFGALGIKCSPLVVFRHGLGRGRADVLNIADTLTAAGFTVAAIDAAKHGDRSFCTSGSATVPGTTNVPQCAAGSSCVTNLPPGAQADAQPIGCCVPTGGQLPSTFPTSCGTTSPFLYQAVGGGVACNGGPCTAGIPTVSASFLVTTNFFRTRDTLRQDFIDQSQLVRAVAFVPSGAPPTGHKLFDFMAAQGVIIDPANVFYVGQSLGSIQGAGNVATNPRISKAVLNVGGGTVVDVFTTSPAFGATTLALLNQLNIQPGTPQFLQFLIVAKTVLDPADPVNFAQHLSTDGLTLPNLLADPTGHTPQASKSLLTQAAFCDQVVPNAWNFLFDSNVACGPKDAPVTGATPPVCTAPLPISVNFGATGPFSLFFKNTGATPNLTACPGPTIPPTSGAGTPGAINHGFLLDFADPAATAQAQTDAVTFLSAGTQPPSLRVVP
jgi:hypothetical protein